MGKVIVLCLTGLFGVWFMVLDVSAADLFSVEVGGISIVVPLPHQDFVRVGYENEELREFFKALMPPSNRFLCAYVLRNELMRINAGDVISLSRSIVLQVYRDAEFYELTTDDFAYLVRDAENSLGSESVMRDARAKVAEQLKTLGLEDIKIDHPVPFGVLFSIQNAWAFGMIVPVRYGTETLMMGSSSCLLRVKNRLLFAYVYSEYKGEETMEWLSATTENWARSILKEN